VNGLRTSSDVILADAGGAAGGDSEYHKVKFEAILTGEHEMGIAAHNIGRSEASFGSAYLRDVAKRLSVPLISANVRDGGDGEPVAESSRVVTAGGRRVLIVGVMSPKFATSSVQVSEPKQAVLGAAAAKKGSYDSLVVLAYLPQDELEQLAASLPEADAVIGGPTGQAMAPRKIGPTLLAAATNKGKFLIELSSASGSAGAWDGTVVEMSASYADDPAQQAGVKTYLAALEQKDFNATQTGLGLPLPPSVPADYKITGSAACVSCHQTDDSVWAHSKHAHAWETIRAKGFHVDSYCQSCHTTGFGLPGGFATRADAKSLGGVGCENCHGPSLAHVKNPKTARTTFAAADQCVRCHDHENSPTFAYPVYWARVQHGTKTVTALTGER
jgi:2',3'-cyclic-nucleotide 2'-phosphodiesterase (5'-nucleotidase family)